MASFRKRLKDFTVFDPFVHTDYEDKVFYVDKDYDIDEFYRHIGITDEEREDHERLHGAVYSMFVTGLEDGDVYEVWTNHGFCNNDESICIYYDKQVLATIRIGGAYEKES